MDYNDTGHADPSASSTYAAAAANLPNYPNNGFCWNDSQQPASAFHQIPPQYDQMPFQQQETKFTGLSLKAIFAICILSILAGSQWGKTEIDQTIPWNLENNGYFYGLILNVLYLASIHDQSFHPQQQPHPPPQSHRYNRNSKWDQQAPIRDDGSAFGNNLYATTPPYGMVHTFGGVGDNRLVFKIHNYFYSYIFRFLLMAKEEMLGRHSVGVILLEVVEDLQFLIKLENLADAK